MTAEPKVWILSGGRKGDLDQMLVLARAMGWSFAVKQIAQGISPPWPDLVLCAEAKASRIARRIKRLSAGRTRAVCLGRPAGTARHFDLVITTPQYRIPAAPNVVELALPLAGIAEQSSAVSPDGPIALVIGGPAFPDILDGPTAARLASDAIAYAGRRGKTLSVQTSPRTPPDALRALRAAVSSPHVLGVFGEGENRYAAVLAAACEIVVTSDSISMLSDALAAGKPVSVYPLPQSRNLTWQAGEWLYRNAVKSPSTLLSPVRWLFDMGFIEAAADRRRLHARLLQQGRIARFGDAPPRPQPAARGRDLERAVESLRALMA